MYSYSHDEISGGLLLNSSPTTFSKEPRPVYAAELDILGFNAYWEYDKQNDVPYMWAEANTYWYRGTCVAKLKGGNICKAPEIIIPLDEQGDVIVPEPYGIPLRPIDMDLMLKKNAEFISILEQTTIKKIVAIYEKYVKKIDLFHVAYSGGKDSAVLLDLVKKALPHGSFVVIFGDTGMEFPDTYDNIVATKSMCEREGIPFYTARSHLTPEQSWKMFGPPSRVLRWCCSVHKSAPQMLKLREITGKNDYIGLAFVGVRLHESVKRAKYEYENLGKKVKGQYDFYPILEWASAEIFLYLFCNKIPLNTTYTHGNSRAGCIVCPMVGGYSEYMRNIMYPNETKAYCNFIRNSSDKNFTNLQFADFMSKGAWKSRADGRFICDAQKKYTEHSVNGTVHIKICNPQSNWKEWIKTLDREVVFSIEAMKDGYIVHVAEEELKKYPSSAKIFRQIFRKAAYCRACGVCRTNCKNGCLQFYDKVIRITDCRRCLDCHNLSGGCLLYDSLKIPNGGIKMRAINSFTEHAPKSEWIVSFFSEKENFFSNHSLGPDQLVKFKVFLTDASLAVKTEFSTFAKLLCAIGWESQQSWALILINLLSENPQMRWYVQNLDLGRIYTKKEVIDMLLSDALVARAGNAVAKAYKRIVETPLGTTLHFGHVTSVGEIVRTKCTVSDPRVVLYALFKFAEKCNDYKEFTLSTLMDDSVDRDGISPSRIFGLTREELIPMLIGLSAKYPEFISATFTHDLEKIALAQDKNSAQVLNLFMEEEGDG